MNKLCLRLVLAFSVLPVYGVTTALTFVNPNAVSVEVIIFSGEFELDYHSQTVTVPANAAAYNVTYESGFSNSGAYLSAAQVVVNVSPIVSGLPLDGKMVYVRGTDGGTLQLAEGLVGTPKIFTLHPESAFVWNKNSLSGVSYQDNTSDTDGLRAPVTQELFREGVEMIASAVAAGGGGGGGGSGGVQGEALATAQNAALAGAESTFKPSASERVAAAGNATTTALSLLPGSSAPSIGDVIVPVNPDATVPAAFSIHFPALMGNATLDLNPFRADRLGPVVSWFRSAVKWLTLVLFGSWVWSKFSEYIRASSTVRQAQGNAIAAGTGGQATAFVAAGIITAAAAVAIGALVGWSFDGMGLGTLLAATSQNPLAGMPAAALWALNMLLPLSTLLACFVGKMMFERFAVGIFVGLMTVVRFCVP